MFNVKDFGAKGDGITDDTEAIKAAIHAAAQAGGGTVKLDEGDYYTPRLTGSVLGFLRALVVPPPRWTWWLIHFYYRVKNRQKSSPF